MIDKLIENKNKILNFFKLYKFYIFLFIFICFLFTHLFLLVFGDKSITVLLDLKEEERNLQNSIEFYMKQNALLQKELFEIQ